jgi:hypothetical protein
MLTSFEIFLIIILALVVILIIYFLCKCPSFDADSIDFDWSSSDTSDSGDSSDSSDSSTD